MGAWTGRGVVEAEAAGVEAAEAAEGARTGVAADVHAADRVADVLGLQVDDDVVELPVVREAHHLGAEHLRVLVQVDERDGDRRRRVGRLAASRRDAQNERWRSVSLPARGTYRGSSSCARLATRHALSTST